MTLARTALRLCAAGVLKGVDGTRPTIAGPRVYDSRISDIQPETFDEDAKAVVIVFTDGEEGEQLSKQNGGPPFRRSIDLVLEIGMVARLPADDGGTFVVDYPDTDARLEAAMDFLELQCVRELSRGLSPLAVQFRRLARIIKLQSHRQVTDESGVKIACRIVTLTCDTRDDDLPIVNAAAPPATGLDRLPEPLRSVAKLMPPGSSGADICAALAAALAPITAPPFTGADGTVDAGSGGTPDKPAAPIQTRFDPPGS